MFVYLLLKTRQSFTRLRLMAAMQEPVAADNINIAEAAAADNNNRPRRERPARPTFTMQERLFQAMFYRAAYTYSIAVPLSARNMLEMCALIKVYCIRMCIHSSQPFIYRI